MRPNLQSNQNRMTFAEILEATQESSAESAWDRACKASQLRHAAIRVGNFRAAKAFGQIKERAVEQSVAVFPEKFKVTIDDDYQVGLLSIAYRGHGRLHLSNSSHLAVSYLSA